MATTSNTFIPKAGVTYANLSGPAKGVTAGPVRQTSSFNQAYTYAAPSVLGASTSQVVPTSPTNVTAPQPSGDNGGQPSISNDDISELYQPALNALTTAGDNASAAFDVDKQNLLDQVASSQKNYDTQQTDLLTTNQSEQDKYNKVLQSAYETAVRAYNALAQQGRARFGALSSAGQAMGELAQQEFFRQQGQIQGKQAEGNQQFGQEVVRIKKFISSKLSDLDNYKNQALAELKKNLNDTLNEIAMRKADVEANKTRDRMAALQDTINRTRDIQAADKAFRQQLGLAAVSKMQEIAGRAFTPAEIKATIQEFMSDLPGNVGSNGPIQGTPLARRSTDNNDEFDQLNVS